MRSLVISSGALSERVAATGIRARQLHRALAERGDSRLIALGGEPGPGHEVIGQWRAGEWRRALRRADVVVAQPPAPGLGWLLRESGARLVFDIHDPEPIALLSARARAGRRAPLQALAGATWQALARDRLLAALNMGHHVLCGSERQRDLYIGTLVAEGLLSSRRHAHDPALRRAVAVVPFAVREDAPRRTGPGPRDLLPGVGPESEIVLWNGGIWNWLDAPTAIRAAGVLARTRPNVRLVFMGRSEQTAGRAAAAAARELARRSGLEGRTVLFHDDWVPYERIADWLLEADCAVLAAPADVEDRFALRSRLLDCLWAALPMVCAGGDELSERAGRDGYGETVAPGDVEGLAAALDRALTRGREAYAPALAAAREPFTSSRAAGALLALLEEPPGPRLGRHPLLHPARVARGVAYDAGRLALRLTGLSGRAHL